jgi:glutathione S-transferase
MITIYNFAGGARGLRVAWQCEEMGLAYTPVSLTYPTPPDYRAKYPPGSVPFLEDEGGVGLGESVAIMLYLAERYGPTPLLPREPAALAQVLQFTVFAESAIGGTMNALMAAKFGAPEADKTNWSVRLGEGSVAGGLAYVAAVLGDRPFLVGDDITLADIAVAPALGMWKAALGGEIPGPLEAWRTRLGERPAYQRARAAFPRG